MAAGRVPSWPLVPMAYDLLVDCGDSIQRVQVKTATAREARYHVHLTTRRKGVDRPMALASVDYVCLVCDPNRIYVVPSVVLQSPTDPLLLTKRVQLSGDGERFAGYLNAFAIGTGDGSGDGATVDLKVGWYPAQQTPRSAGTRKRHVRLTINEINTLRRSVGTDPSPDVIRATAGRFNITPQTVRNYLRNGRSDLAPVRTETLGTPAVTVAPSRLSILGPLCRCGHSQARHPDGTGRCNQMGCACGRFRGVESDPDAADTSVEEAR